MRLRHHNSPHCIDHHLEYSSGSGKLVIKTDKATMIPAYIARARGCYSSVPDINGLGQKLLGHITL
jgi:hypothetical protein